MTTPHLNLAAIDAADLIETLSRIDIRVPPQNSGRTAAHRERYMAARLLATLASTGALSFPLRLVHREKPDFALHGLTGALGIECVEAIHEEWAQIQAIRERDFPEKPIFLPRLKPGRESLSITERVEFASGERMGCGWGGNSPEIEWAEAIAHVVNEKTKKLRNGNYSEFNRCWLLIQDEWPVPVHSYEDYVEASNRCGELMSKFELGSDFERVYAANSRWLVQLVPAPIRVQPVRDLWAD